jgi:small subunit ribosomal protein S1
VVKAKVLDVDVDKERISLGIKQLARRSVRDRVNTVGKGGVVTCTVTEVTSKAVSRSTVGEPAVVFIRKADLSRDRAEQRPERFAVGEKVDAKVTRSIVLAPRVALDQGTSKWRKKQKPWHEYGSSDSRRVAGRYPRRSPRRRSGSSFRRCRCERPPGRSAGRC